MGDDASSDTTMDHAQHMNMNDPKNDTATINIHNMHDMGGLNISSGVVSLNYDMLRSPVKTALPVGP